MITSKISIVTPSYNQGEYIEETIQSVLDQNYPGLEYIIIDGGSTDNTIEVIKKYEKHLKFWVSEKDKGQANAINKGLKHCTGEIFNWLNSDDYLEKGVLYKIADLFNSDVDLVAGRIQYFDNTDRTVHGNNTNLTAKGLMNWGEGVAFNQPGVWMKKELVKKCGGIREDYHYCFDREMLVRYLYFYPRVKYTDQVFVHFRLHEDSKTVSSRNKFAEEGDRLFEDVLKNPDLIKLHKEADLKIICKQWSDFLKEVRASDKNSVQKIRRIIFNINSHPKKTSYLRMTAGAIKRILTGADKVEN